MSHRARRADRSLVSGIKEVEVLIQDVNKQRQVGRRGCALLRPGAGNFERLFEAVKDLLLVLRMEKAHDGQDPELLRCLFETVMLARVEGDTAVQAAP